MKMCKLIVMVGPAASGKSFYARKYAEAHDAKVISSDAIRKELWGDESNQQNPQTVFAHMYERTLAVLLDGETAIYDATNLSSKRRIALLRRLRQDLGKNRTLIADAVVCVEPIEVILERNKNRSRFVPEDVIMKQIKSFSCPYYHEGFDYIQVWTLTRPTDCSDYILDTINSLLANPHDNPHHPNTIGEHCIAVSQLAMEYVKRFGNKDPYYAYLVGRAGLFHDIGKGYCKTYDSDGIAHYYGHDGVSAYISLLASLTMFSNQESLLIAWAISNHMRHYSYQSEEQFQSWLKTLSHDQSTILHILMLADSADALP
jgi:predicted kinase